MNKSSIIVTSAIAAAIATTHATAFSSPKGLDSSSNTSEQTSIAQLASANTSSYQIGVGLSDITGESAEANMFGYADGEQISTGIQQRLHARAFVIGDGTKEVLMVVLDTGSISQAMHQDLLKRLSVKYGDRFTKDNVMLTATHTHSAPGGYSHYALYGITTRGFQEPTFDALQRGSMRAIDKAITSQSTGTLEFGTSQLTNANVQRSRTAYDLNPESEKTERGTETLMQVIKMVKEGEEVASMNWFAVHPTSLTNKNTLVSGDNKGYAAWYIENQKGTDYLKGEGYVAAFPNTNPGDMSPNLNLKPGSGPTEDQWQNAKILGQRQADSAMSTATPNKVVGNIDYRQNYVDFSKQQIDAKYTVDGKPHRTCSATYKSAFAAGSTEDGGGGDALVASNIVDEGRDNPLLQALGYIISWPSKDLLECQETNRVTLSMGTLKPYPGSPEVLPSQLLRIGNLAVISVPSEFTIVAGQRLRHLVANKLNLPYDNVIFGGYSGAYAGYITTPEEYKRQDYEGASNHFGPHSLEAWMQNLDILADALVNKTSVAPGPTPRDLSANQSSLVPGVVLDTVPNGKNFGDIQTQPAERYSVGEQAKAVFWSAHPKSTLAYQREVDAKNLRTVEPYTMAVEYNDGGVWKKVATDYDWNTTNQWKRFSVADSHATLTWDIPSDAESGEYRFYHRGAYKSGSNYIPFEGYSQPFMVN